MQAQTARLDGVDAMLIVAAALLALAAPLLPAGWAFGLAIAGLVAYLAYANARGRRGRRRA